MQKVAIADSTETIYIVIWQDHIEQVNLGHSYEFRNVTVRIFEMVKSLITSPESQIIQIDDIGTVKVHAEVSTTFEDKQWQYLFQNSLHQMMNNQRLYAPFVLVLLCTKHP